MRLSWCEPNCVTRSCMRQNCRKPICAGPDRSVSEGDLVTLNGAASKDEYTSRCKDDPDTPYVNEANLKVADYPMLCN